MEIWKDVPEYEGLYQVSNLGRVKSLSRIIFNPGKNSYSRKVERIIKQSCCQGYNRVPMQTSPNNKKKNSVHRLVMLSFVGPSHLTVDHINGIKTDNRLENLRYLSHTENVTAKNRNQKFSVSGIDWCKKRQKYRSRIRHKYKDYHLGYFIKLDDAIEARRKKEIELNFFQQTTHHPFNNMMSYKSQLKSSSL